MRLIDADELLESSDVFIVHTKEYGSIEVISVDAVGDAPTVDAVPAVRCRECKHRKYDDIFGTLWCNRDSCTKRVKQDDFCSYGNRKEDS